MNGNRWDRRTRLAARSGFPNEAKIRDLIHIDGCGFHQTDLGELSDQRLPSLRRHHPDLVRAAETGDHQRPGPNGTLGHEHSGNLGVQLSQLAIHLARIVHKMAPSPHAGLDHPGDQVRAALDERFAGHEHRGIWIEA